MNDIAVRVENLSKKYLRKPQTTFIHSYPPVTKKDPSSPYFWALQDINLEIQKGDIIGIIGKNGAGKSTLLKILSRIISPTKGFAKIKGKVQALLELGTGFHRDLTAKENIFLNGALLGMKKDEIKSKFDEIVTFAGVEAFVDSPVKFFSSGMYVRLAFSVAVFLNADILLLDEMLAVGDVEFQKKSNEKLKTSLGSGKTVLIVSHHLDTLAGICNKSILLENGKLIAFDHTPKVIQDYLKSEVYSFSVHQWQNTNAPGNHFVKLKEIKAHTEQGENLSNFDITQPLGITLIYEVLEEGHKFTHGFNLYNIQGIHILSSHDLQSEIRNQDRKKGLYSATVWIPPNLLAEGIFVVGAALFNRHPFQIYVDERTALSFTVVDYMNGNSAKGLDYFGGFPGVVRPLLQWNAKFLK